MQSLVNPEQQVPTHMNLLEILNHLQMGNSLQGSDFGDDFYFEELSGSSKATPRAIVESLPVRFITQD